MQRRNHHLGPLGSRAKSPAVSRDLFSQPLPPADDRKALRRQLRRLRRSLAPAERRRSAFALARHLATDPRFQRARSVAFYLANEGEMDPAPLLERALAAGKSVWLPVLRPGGQLWFVRWRRGDRLRPNRFGIPEPARARAPRRAPWALDLVLVPLVAFDGDGNRLGMGGGFYDRSFAFMHGRSSGKPRLAGLAYAWQEVPALPPAEWDVPLALIATDTGLREVTRALRPEAGR